MDLTPAELTVLGLIVERPRHGYDLEQVIEQRGVRQWTDIAFSSIYYLLTKLEKRGLIEVAEAPAAAKSRRVFRATTAGREAARHTARALLAELRPVPLPQLVGLANLPLLSAREYAEALRTRLAQLEARIAVIEQAARAQSPLVPAAREVFSYSLSLLEAERSWLLGRVQGRGDPRAPDDGRDDDGEDARDDGGADVRDPVREG